MSRHDTRTCPNCGIAVGAVEVPVDDEDERAEARTAAGFRRHAEHEAARAYARQLAEFDDNEPRRQ